MDWQDFFLAGCVAGFLIWLLGGGGALLYRRSKRNRWSTSEVIATASTILDANNYPDFRSVGCWDNRRVQDGDDTSPDYYHPFTVIGEVVYPGLGVLDCWQKSAEDLVKDLGVEGYDEETSRTYYTLSAEELEMLARRREMDKERTSITVMKRVRLGAGILFLVTLAIMLVGRYFSSDLVAQSDSFFAKVNAGRMRSNLPAVEWLEERARLSEIIAKIENDSPSSLQATIYYRMGVTLTVLSNGKGSQKADPWFARAENCLHAADANHHDGRLPQYAELLTVINRERAKNNILRGDDGVAIELLQKALRYAQSCSYAGELGESMILEQIAGIYFRAEHWSEALEHASRARAIMISRMGRPGFNRAVLLMPLIYEAVARNRLGQNAEADLDACLKLCRRYMTPRQKSDIYREMADTVKQHAQKKSIEAYTGARALEGVAREHALQKANDALRASLQKAQDYLATAQRVESEGLLFLDEDMHKR